MIDKIKIVGVNYSVDVVDKFDMSESERAKFVADGFDPENMIKWGEVEYEKSMIRIHSSLSEEKKKQTIIHEVLHAIFHEAGFDKDNEDEVNRLAIVLHQVLVDNDFNWLKS